MQNENYYLSWQFTLTQNHTQYSNLRLRDCIIKEKDLIEYAVELGHEVVAITDHEAVCNAVKVEKIYKNIKKDHPDFKVILGNEIYLCRNGLNANNYNREYDRYWHFVLLAKDAIGHKQIREISTRAWRRSYMARGMRRVPTYYQDLIDIIGANPGHVIGTSGCLGGALPTQLLRAKNNPDLYPKIYAWIEQMNGLFGQGNFYFELQPSESKDQTYVNRQLIKLSRETNVPYIITTDSHYLKKEDKPIHKAYLNSQNGDREVDDFYATTYMMNTEELESHMDLTEDELHIAYDNIHSIKEMCEDYSLLKPLKIPQLPWRDLGSYTIDKKKWQNRIPYLSHFWDSSYEGDNHLADAICLKLEEDKRLQDQKIYDAVNECLEMTWISSEVNKTHWSAYYLNLQKIIDSVWEAGSLVGPGRGSGVGFILLYLLGITQINPVWEDTKTYAFRFLNPERVSVLDIDFDSEGIRRNDILNKFREVYGSDRIAGVATFGTEKSKSAILTACRGLNIDVDIAQYLSSMIESDRGQLRSLKQTFYGDEEAGFSPNKQFVYEMTENYPEVWSVAQKIEGLVCRLGSHAGGVIFKDEDFTESVSLMRTPKGEIITAFDLHDVEDCGDIKYDVLSINALDKIHNCLDLLIEQGYVEDSGNLKENYEKVVGIYNIERNNPKMWEMVHNHEIQSLFQMEQQSGIKGIELVKPNSVAELATLNSVIRLMAPEKGAEQPLDMWNRYRQDINQWYQEMRFYGLSEDEINWLANYPDITQGIAESQECLMKLVQEERLGGNNLNFADKCRKGLAKKDGPLFKQCEEEFFKKAEEKNCSQKLVHYVWDVLLRVQRNYSFNKSHTLAYSLVALQEMNLAYRFPIIFWNCACLISDSGGAESDDEEQNEEENMYEEVEYNSFEDFSAAEDSNEDDDDEEEEEAGQVKKKKKAKSANYGRIATAIGKIKSSGVDVAPPDINKSSFTFYPDVDNNTIRYGLSGITKIGEELVKAIIDNRPYSSVEDLTKKVKINKAQVINLIKSGAFDVFGERTEIMRQYINSISDTKKRITLQNMKMLCDFGLIPDEYDLQRRVYNFNKYLKKFKLKNYYALDMIAFNFYESNFDMDKLEPSEISESGFIIKQTIWDNIYQSHMDIIRPWVKENANFLLEQVNNKLTCDMWNKYCTGNLSKWEMDAVSFYSHDHELKDIRKDLYEITDFSHIPENPVVERVLPIKGKQIPIFKLWRIAGTILDKDKNKKTVTLLTTDGVVTAKIFGAVFTHYDKQISEKGADGKKHVIEKSWLSRGNKIIVTGIKQSDGFLAKKYSRTPYHLVELITGVNEDGTLITRGERAEEE